MNDSATLAFADLQPEDILATLADLGCNFDCASAAEMDALLQIGVAPERISARGYGSSQPIADNATPEGQAQNRRVELRVIGGQ